MDIITLAREWLSYNRKNNIDGIEILPHKTPYGLVVYFYFEDTWIDLPYMLTIPMVEALLEGKNPKKVKNDYLRSNKEETNQQTV